SDVKFVESKSRQGLSTVRVWMNWGADVNNGQTEALYDLAYNVIEPQLERLNGVASASVDGGKIRQITVNLNRDELFAKGLSILDVVRAVNTANFLLPAGDIKAGRLDYNIYTNNQFTIVRPMED